MKKRMNLKKTARSLGAKELSEFCSQMAVMLSSGITFPKAVSILQMNPEKRKAADIYRDLEIRLEQGNSIGDAMTQMEVFPEMMVSMFYAGEMSGRLPETAKRLADHYKKEHKLRGRIKTAMLYPEILGVMSFMVILVIFLVIMPMVEPVFEGMELPAITRFFLGFSNFLKEKWYFLPAGSGLFWILQQRWKKKDRVIRLLDRGKLWIPMARRPLQIIYTARFARAMSSLYAGGLTMIQCMEIAGEAIGNRYVQDRFSEVLRRVSEGEMLSHAIKDLPGIDMRLSSVVFVGEETGKLDQMLDEIADGFEYEAEMTVDRLAGLVEPAMILVMGTMIGLILVAIMIPVWNMYGSIV